MTDKVESRTSNLKGRRVIVTQETWTENGMRDTQVTGVIECEIWSKTFKCPLGYRVRVEPDEPFIGTYIIYANDEEITLL